MWSLVTKVIKTFDSKVIIHPKKWSFTHFCRQMSHLRAFDNICTHHPSQQNVHLLIILNKIWSRWVVWNNHRPSVLTRIDTSIDTSKRAIDHQPSWLNETRKRLPAAFIAISLPPQPGAGPSSKKAAQRFDWNNINQSCQTQTNQFHGYNYIIECPHLAA